MSTFVVHDEFGRIRQVMTGPLEACQASLQHMGSGLSLLEVEEGYQFDQYREYVDADQLLQMPGRPSPHHRFDWQAKQWVDSRNLDQLRAAKRAEIKAERDRRELLPIEYGSTTLDADLTALRRLSGAVSIAKSAIAAGQQFSQQWTAADNSVVQLEAQDFVLIEQALAYRTANLFQVAQALQTQIETATAEELENIQWP